MKRIIFALFLLADIFSNSFAQTPCITASASSVNPSCTDNDGSITITIISGGGGTYQYSLSNTFSPLQASATFGGLSAGNYTVYIRDKNAHACTGSISAILSSYIQLSATVISTNACNGVNNGTLNITAKGGTGAYQYSKNGVNWLSNGGVFSNLSAGDYTIQIRDFNNKSCIYTYTPVVTISELAALTATVTKSDITCNGLTDGKITITNAAGGTGPYFYSIDGSNYVPSYEFTGLGAATYKIYVQDQSTLCANQVATRTILDPALLSGSASVTANVTGCFGGSNGSITVNATGGSGFYQYSKTGNTGSWVSNGGVFDGLTAGDYTIHIRDKNNTLCPTFTCSTITVDQPDALTATVTKSDISCHGLTDGKITITNAAGGTGPYFYSIDGSNYVPSNEFTGLGAATYKIYVQDQSTLCANQVATRTIVDPDILSATVDFSNVTCFGASDGTIIISSPKGGWSTYQYTIDGGSAVPTWQNDGNYNNRPFSTNDVRIRDKVHQGCFVILNGNLEITRPPKLNATVAKTNITCNGANDGTITITSPSGGPSSLLPAGGKYYYSDDGGKNYLDNGGLFTHLSPSVPNVSYDIWIQDATDPDCTVDLGFQTITEPVILSAAVISNNVTCFDAADGTITITPSGGWGTWQYSKDGGTTWLNNKGLFTKLIHGSYDIWINDKANSGCKYDYGNVIITRPPILKATVTPTNLTCNGANDGKITITSPSGGPSSLLSGGGTYLYSIHGDNNYLDNKGLFTDLPPSSPTVSYDVWIQDATDLDCTVDLGVQTITEPAPQGAPSASATDQPTCSVSTGTITVSSITTGLHFSIDGTTYTNTSGIFTGVAAGDYYVTARNADNCVSAQSGKVTINAQPDAPGAPSASATDQPTCSVSTGTITVSSTTTGLHFSIDGTTYTNTSGIFTGVAAGDYYVTARNADNCVSAQSGKVTINAQPDAPGAPSASATDQPTCSVSTGTITVSSTKTGLHFSIDGTTYTNTSGIFTGVAAGDYYVTARNADNCVSAQSGKATINAQPSICTPTTQASNIVFSAVQSTQFTASWTNGNGTSRAVFIKQANAGTTTPVDGTNYTANTAFGIGDQITPGWYCVYNGTGSTVTVTGLTAGADYIIQVFEYNGTTGTEKYNTSTATDNPNNTITTTGCINPTSGGTIAATQTICSGTTPAAFTSIAAASAQTGTLEYKWQWSTTSATANNFADFASSNSPTYAPGSLSVSTWYKRLARVSCKLNWTGAAESNVIEITVNPLPAPFNVTGGTGVAIGLDGSQVGVNYQLVNGTTNTGSPVPGTGSALSFGIQSAAGTYTIVATYTTTSCTRTMTGSAVVTSGTSVYTVTGGGSFCANASGVPVGLSGTKRGTLYQLKLNGHGIGNVVIGTGSAISFGLKTVPGTYTIAAVTILPVTSVPMTGSAIITVNPLPPAPGAITGTTAICVGNTSTLNKSTTGGVWSSSNTAIATVSDVGVVTGLLPGTVTIRYTVTNGSGCSNSASIALTVSSSVSQPSNFNLSTSSVRQGQRNVLYSVPSVAGVVYGWSYSGLGATISGTTNLVFISFSNTATSGILSVYASNGCGLSIARTMSITVEKNRLKMDTISAISPTGILENPNLKNELKIFPNPTQGSATFEFRINENARVKLDVYSMTGQRIIQIYNGDVQAGVTQTVLFDQTLPTGLYPCVLSWNGKIITLKFAVTQ